MHIPYDSRAPKRAVNLSLNEDLVRKARALGVNISAAAEAGVAKVVSEAERLTLEKTADAAMFAWNDFEAEFGSVADEFEQS